MAYIGVPPADRTSGARVRDEFTADGTQVCFQLSQEVPGSFESNIIAVVENVIQEPVSAYTIIDTVTVALTSISGTFTKNETITGGTSAATGKVIQVNAGSVVITVTTGTFQAAESITGGSSSATATISTLTTNIGRGLNFSGTPTTGTKIYALHQNSATYQLKPAAGSVTPETLSENLRTFTVDKFTATSSQTAFTLSTAPVSVKSILVFVDGVMQTETTHYTLSGVTLTIGASLTAGQQVSVVHLGFSTVSRTAFPDASITTAMIADGAITSDKIATGGVATIDMADGSVTSLKIANGGIATADLADASVTTAKLDSTLDLSGKTITYRSIVAGDIASNAITTAKIADANVTSGKLASGAAVSNIGYTPVNKAGDTVTGRLVVKDDVNADKSFPFGIQNGSQQQWWLRSETTTNRFSVSLNGLGNVIEADSSGRVTMPYQPSFSAHLTGTVTNVTTGVIPFAGEHFDVGSNYNNTTYRFTAPVAGKYYFSVDFYASIRSGGLRVVHGFFRKNGTTGDGFEATSAGGTGGDGGYSAHPTVTSSCIIDLATSDYVDFYISSASYSGGFDFEPGTRASRFYGFLIG
jgi:hypothetical protein